jgi:HD-GYP domain-containing protein (c-di-GMP phosphodiesterase class II)
MQQEEAFAELVRHSGTQFDRDVVEALIATELARPSATLDAIRSEPPSTADGRPLAA